ncbi:MAG TPA: TIGR01212 family radical SAM protein [Bacteroidales bacterium]|nr:TIGR01212 family radical SAM protein [Bacteroidales bacterium]
MSLHPRYRKFQSFLNEYFVTKVQKISINAGFTCPNRDGNKGLGGCTYCNNQTFNPAYCETDKTITAQLEEGIRFFAHKYPQMDYLAYFQAYTNTYAELEKLKELYQEALSVHGVKGLVIGTRPDCMPEDLLDYLEHLSKDTFILVEYGVESTLDRTLKFINRGHDHDCTVDAVQRTAARGIPTGVHLILGLPGESHEDLVSHAETLSKLPIQTIKLHQLQLIKGTRMAAQVAANPNLVHIPEPEEYVETVCDFLEHLRQDIAVERFVSQSPAELLIAPNWGLKNYEFTHLVEKSMKNRNSWQGKYLLAE